MTEYLRMSGLYWTLTCLDIMGGAGGDCNNRALPASRQEILEFVRSCQHCSSGGFSPAPEHDVHILSTLSAVQILVELDALDAIDRAAVVEYVRNRQQQDGSFTGDEWGEIDTRFTFCCLATLALLGELSAIDREAAVAFLERCKNFDGGFGTRPGAESHSGQIYCCLGSLSILDRMDVVDADRLAFWLADRQLPNGGLNGRPEKQPDVCYSWWVLASLAMLNRLHWIDAARLRAFILACQDAEIGGIADRPGNLGDPFHTLFGVAGLSLLKSSEQSESRTEADSAQHMKTINPVLCMPQHVIDRIALPLALARKPSAAQTKSC